MVLEEVQVASPSVADLTPGEVLLRTLAGGICGSDYPAFAGAKGLVRDADGVLRGRVGAPLHEIVGVVEGSRDDTVRVGDHVVGWAGSSDGLAERIVTRAARVHRYRAGTDPVSAVLLQPLACVLEALDRVEVSDRDVAVLGLGPIGLLFSHLARSRGARSIVGIDPVDRGHRGAALGLDRQMVATGSTWAETAGGPAYPAPQVVVEAVGHQTSTVDDAIKAVAIGGTVLCFGIPDQDVYPIDMERIMRKNLTVVGGVTRQHAQSLAGAEDYLHQHPGLVDLLLTHRFPRVGAQAAFEAAARPSADRLKVVIDLA
jgi:threonine dehydrogenase-like Zn-dependent dehydrogenase